MEWILDSFGLALIGKILIRILLTGVLAGAIGYERESANQPAGFRTHIMVGIGACLVALMSEYLSVLHGDALEPEMARLAAAVISGIGFLGAGTIIRDGTSIRGLTTAASVWTVACIGLAVGIGFISGAIAAAVLTYITLAVLPRFEKLPQRDVCGDGQLTGQSTDQPDSRQKPRAARRAAVRDAKRARHDAGDPSEPPEDNADLPPESDARSSPEGDAGLAPGGGTDCLAVALARTSHDVLGLLRLLESQGVAVRAVRVLDSGDASGDTVHVWLETGSLSPAVRAGVIDSLLADRRIIRVLPDAPAGQKET